MKECGTVIRINLDFNNAFNSAGHSCLWAILRGLGVPDVDFFEELYTKSWMKITVGTGCSAINDVQTCSYLVTMYRQCPIWNKKKGNCHFPNNSILTHPALSANMRGNP